MPGSRGKNLRAGDLCEGFGLEMLRPFAFIAPVPRTEDVGVDAVATLSRVDGPRLVAEDSFMVQVKAASVREIRYKGDELDWLRSLKLPFFILSVDLKTSTLELHAMINAYQHPNFRDWGFCTMYLDEKPSYGIGQAWLGPPILRWNPLSAADGEFQQTAYEVLKAWVEIEMLCVSLRTIGMTKGAKWATNQIPKLLDAYAIFQRPSEFRSVLERMIPHVQWLQMAAFSSAFGPDADADELVAGLLLLIRFMRKHEVDPDPMHSLESIARARARHGEIKVQIG